MIFYSATEIKRFVIKFLLISVEVQNLGVKIELQKLLQSFLEFFWVILHQKLSKSSNFVITVC